MGVRPGRGREEGVGKGVGMGGSTEGGEGELGE